MIFPKNVALPVTHSNESSVAGDADFALSSQTQQLKCAFSELSEVQFDPAANSRVHFTEDALDNLSQADSAHSIGVEASQTPAPAFDTVIQPYLNTLPASISQHSIFTLPKPT